MPEEKKKRGTLKTFTFKLRGRYASGVIVVVAYNLKSAQKKAEPVVQGDFMRGVFGISGPESFTDYEETPVKPGVVAYHSYAE